MAHGYAKIEGRPALVALHGTVGTQHASMAVYDAFCDRVPVYLLLGNHLDAVGARSQVEWVHSAQDAAAMIRDFVEVGRCAGVARRTSPSRLSARTDRDDAADGAGRDGRGRRPAGASGPGRDGASHPEARDAGAAAAATPAPSTKWPGCSSPPRIPCSWPTAWPARRRALTQLVELAERAAGGRHRSQGAHEFSDAPPAQSVEPRRRRARRRRPRSSASRLRTSRARDPRTGRSEAHQHHRDDLFTRSNYQDFQRFAEVGSRDRRRRARRRCRRWSRR